MPNSDDNALATAASKGNTEAFEKLVENYFTGILSVCFSITGNSQDAEDCTQEAFIKAYRNIQKYDQSASFFTWLYRIAVNTCYDLKRKQKRNMTISIDDTVETEDGSFSHEIEDTRRKPDQEMIQAMSDQRIQELIDQLPENHSRILRLKDIDGLSYQEIAIIENINEGTVKSRLARARIAFAKIAGKEDLYDL